MTYRDPDTGEMRPGRAPRSANKRTHELRAKLAKQAVPDPIVALCRMAVDARLTPEQRTNAAAKATPYIWPRVFAAQGLPVGADQALTADRLQSMLQGPAAKPVGTPWRPPRISDAPAPSARMVTASDPIWGDDNDND